MSSIKKALPEECVGLIPAAGKGSRLGLPFPKELFPIINEGQYKPVAQYSLEYLLTANVKHIVFIINESKHALMGYFGGGNRFNCNISYVLQEPWQTDTNSKSPGLAHALDAAYHLSKDKIVFFCMPDTIISPISVLSQAKQNAPENADIIFCLFPTLNPEKYGMVEYDPDLRAKKVFDKPNETDLLYMWGCIIWKPAFSNFLHNSVVKESKGDFAEILNEAISSDLNAFIYLLKDGEYFDVGTYTDIANLYHHFQN